MYALCWSSREEIPHVQGKRNSSKMVGVARGHQRADTLNPYSQKTSQSNHTRTAAVSNSMKPSHACGATQDGRIMVERSDRMWSTGEGNGKPLQYSCLENPMGRGAWWVTVYGIARVEYDLVTKSSSPSLGNRKQTVELRRFI